MADVSVGAFAGQYNNLAISGEIQVVTPKLMPEPYIFHTGFDVEVGSGPDPGSTRPQSGQLFPRGDK